MTRQAPDLFNMDGVSYKMMDASRLVKLGFDVQGVYLNNPISTICYRGYLCELEVMNEELRLVKVSMSCVPPYTRLFECNPVKVDNVIFPVEYHVNQIVDYTGRIILVKDYVAGFSDLIWSYGTVLELVFEEGLLMECNDISNVVREVTDGAMEELEKEAMNNCSKQQLRKMRRAKLSKNKNVVNLHNDSFVQYVEQHRPELMMKLWWMWETEYFEGPKRFSLYTHPTIFEEGL